MPIAAPVNTINTRINRGHDRELFAEQVYRALVSLQQTGAVRRVSIQDSRKAFWEAAVEVTREEVS